MTKRNTPALRTRTKVFLASALAIGLTVGGSTAAHAEGHFTSNMSQVQPTFKSRQWEDKNSDGASTIVTLANCKANAGGKKSGSLKIKSVTLSLYDGKSYVGSIKHACGTYNFSNPGRNSGWSFAIRAINGNTKTNRTTFLNADVSVSY